MTQGTLSPLACLEPEVLGALAEGRLAGAERDAAVRHLATCRRCHEIFASSVQILEGEGVLPIVRDAAPAPRRPLMVWLSAAAAALVSAVLFVQRAPVAVPRIAEASPTPVATASPLPTATPSAVQTASLPPEAVEALRTLGGFSSPYAAPSSVGFAANPRGRAVAQGIADVDAVAQAFAHRAPAPEPSGPVDDWRRVGRLLEASRLALLDPTGKPERFFASPWARSELEHASRVLREAQVRDVDWAEGLRADVPIDGATAQRMLERLDVLLRSLL